MLYPVEEPMRRLALAFAVLVLGSQPRCRPLPAQAARAVPAQAAAQPTPQETVVRLFVEAFNRKDLDSLLALADTAISWLTVIGDSTRLDAHGRPGLRVSLESYFRTLPSAKSTLESVRGVNRWVSAWEQASWDAPDGPWTQLALSVYEVQEGRVRRVYYYPAIRIMKQ